MVKMPSLRVSRTPAYNPRYGLGARNPPLSRVEECVWSEEPLAPRERDQSQAKSPACCLGSAQRPVPSQRPRRGSLWPAARTGCSTATTRARRTTTTSALRSRSTTSRASSCRRRSASGWRGPSTTTTAAQSTTTTRIPPRPRTTKSCCSAHVGTESPLRLKNI